MRAKNSSRIYIIITVTIAFIITMIAVIENLNSDRFSSSKLADKFSNRSHSNPTPTIIPTPTITPTPEPKRYINPPPELNAKAYSIVDLTNDVIMFTKNSDTQLSPASVTKIMTAVVAIEDYNLDKEVEIPTDCINRFQNTAMAGFLAGEVYTIEDLLYGLLVKSGADAACTIASIVGEDNFVDSMNKKAETLGLKNTNFSNEVGLDQDNNHLSTVDDLLKLSRHALSFGVFRKIVGTKTSTLSPKNSKRVIALKNTNDLLFTIPGTTGIKTGYTPKAGECLSFLWENKKQRILIVMLGSDNRFAETLTLLNWANKQIELLNYGSNKASVISESEAKEENKQEPKKQEKGL